jgi:protein-S-isoprenylcysteine O-methyltransferase Ste14
MEATQSHFGNWIAVLIWILLYSIFLGFIPFYRKSQRKPAGVYLAFIVALALEMFGVPLSMYFIAWIIGHRLPEGVLWGHTLVNQIGFTGMYIAIALTLVGAALIITGWSRIYRQYWSKTPGAGQLVTSGIYRYIRHPQYAGFMLITLGCLLEWATIPLLVMWPILAVMYFKLARMEERDMEAEFGGAYVSYRKMTAMFIPGIL